MKKKPAKKATKSRVQKSKSVFPLDNNLIDLITSEPNPEDHQQPQDQTNPQPVSHLLITGGALNAGKTKHLTPKETLKQKNAERKTRIEAEMKLEEQKAILQRVTARKKAFIKAMVKSLGIVTKAVQSSGIPERTHFWWMEHDEVYRDKINSIKEVALDFYEDALHELIRQKHPAAIIFALKTQGRRRGYIETVHNVNQNMDDNNMVFYLPDNKRDEDIQDAKIISQ